jgi:3-oxoacyl-[acyl-carrier protein] reductase
MGKLSNKVAVITGGGRGIGYAIAAKFLQEDAAGVGILEFDPVLAATAADRLDPTGSRVLASRCDVAKKEQVRVAIDRIIEKFGTIDILVNNAGILRDKMLHKMEDEEWHSVIDVSLHGAYNVTRRVIPIMRERGRGSIINLSSISSEGNVGQANYASAKAALKAFTTTLAIESGRKNIRVNAIAPGYIETEMLGVIPPDILANNIARIPLGRMGTPEELANVALFLASDESSFVSGSCVTVSGGGKI